MIRRASGDVPGLNLTIRLPRRNGSRTIRPLVSVRGSRRGSSSRNPRSIGDAVMSETIARKAAGVCAPAVASHAQATKTDIAQRLTVLENIKEIPTGDDDCTLPERVPEHRAFGLGHRHAGDERECRRDVSRRYALREAPWLDPS